MAQDLEDFPTDCDVHVSCPALDSEVVRVLALKGFCVIGTDFPSSLLSNALKDIRRIRRFKPPPALLVEGLLGPEGSSEVAELERPSLEPDERTDGESIRELDSFMTWLAATIDPHLEPELGFVCGQRTVGMLHRVSALGAVDDAPDITEKDAARWLHIFRRHRLMVLVVLAARGGVLRLQPFDEVSDEEAIEVKRGQVVVLRADALSHTFEGRTDKDYVLSCWLLQQDRSGPRGAFADGREGMPMIPVAKDIVEWANNRMMAVKSQMDAEAGSLADQDIPRNWKLIASHSFTRGVQIAVRGMAINLPTGCGSAGTLYAPLSCGADFGVEVPFTRWDHFDPGTGYNVVYDPDPDCWRNSRLKTNVRHATFIDGHDLFDHKFFNMSLLESRVMDPNQRLALESAYEALSMAGYTRKSLMQAFIGVYQGHTASDWDKIPHDQAGGCAGSYSPTIASNRINFALGVMGPSFTIDVEGASSLAALYQGAHDLLPSADLRKPLVAAALSGGVTLNLSPFWWPVHNQFMSPAGRTMTFDRNASGYIKGEGSAMVALKRHADMVEGKLVTDESKPNLALVSSWSIINSGSCASLTAPNGPAMQQAVADCVRHASLSPLDVDAVECDGKASLIHDAVELTCVSRVLRGIEGGDKEVLSFTSQKPKLGFTQETAGIAGLLSVLVTQRHGTCFGNIHLRELNPHADVEDAAVHIGHEPTSYRCRSSFHGISAYGFGGTNVHALLWAEMDETVHPINRVPLDRQVFTFWPGGGGELEDSAKPDRGYSIMGSWSSWEYPERMRPEGDGAYGFTVTLGENRFEQFQIWVDGDSQRVLHPGRSAAPVGSAVHGPVPLDNCQGCNWLIDGRPQLVPALAGKARRPGAPGDDELDEAASTEASLLKLVPMGSRDVGFAGDQYHVRLQVAGKWRAVTWERISSFQASGADAVNLARGVRGNYFVAASWSGWSFVPMEHDEDHPGLFRLDVRLEQPGGLFQIVRNKDWSQAFYPADEHASLGRGSQEVSGPDSAGHGMNWFLDGQPGDVFRIEFQRLVDGEEDRRAITWRRLSGRTLREGLEDPD